jgi:hypothetical protein
MRSLSRSLVVSLILLAAIASCSRNESATRSSGTDNQGVRERPPNEKVGGVRPMPPPPGK